MLRKVLPGLSDVQIARLLLAGEFSEIAAGTTLANENNELQTLFFIRDGRLRVQVAGREIALLEKGNFVGEVAFLTEKRATATVVTESSVRALVFDKNRLSQFFHSEAEVPGLSYQLLGRELALKIKGSNDLISAVKSAA